MQIELLRPHQLQLNPDNDRHGPLKDEASAIQWLLENRDSHMRALAEDLATTKRLYEPPLVRFAGGGYVVFDGNRRACCIKLLNDPTLAPSESWRNFFADLSSTELVEAFSAITCEVETDLAVIDEMLYRRHTGKRAEALEQEIDSIKERYIYCSDFQNMNDPMEGFFESSPELRAHARYREAIQNIRFSKLRFGLACFSETNENVLMWAHYANNYSGMCIEYSALDLIAGLPRGASVVRMAYVDELPEISQNEAKNAGDAAAYILSQKKSSWAYEREWRVLADKGEVRFGLEQPITAIYFGARISNSNRQRVLTRIQGTGIKAYMMEVNGYEHEFTPINAPARPKAKAKTVRVR